MIANYTGMLLKAFSQMLDDITLRSVPTRVISQKPLQSQKYIALLEAPISFKWNDHHVKIFNSSATN